MRRALAGFCWLAFSLCALVAAHAQQAVKVGLIMTYSGQFADAAAQMDNGVKLYMKQHGDTVAGRKIEIIRRDTGGAPDAAKRLAQELIVRDNVDVLAGFVITPEALAIADFSAYVTGHAAEGTMQGAFKAAGGEIVGAFRMTVTTVDFSPFVQRATDQDPEAIFVFIPGGSQPPALAKALVERGIDPKKIKLMGQGEITEESALAGMGDAGVGIITAFHYDYNHQSPTNADFVKAYNAEFKRNPDLFSIGGYHRMPPIYQAPKKNGGQAG